MASKKLPLSKKELINDYRIAYESRQASLLGRKEVLTGKAKFGIFGDGKEIPQLAMARAFEKGDFRSGYYRDQTFMFALGEITIKQFFAQLYAHPDIEAEPATAGRSMNGHYATRSLNPDGSWKSLKDQYNTAADISPTAGQMPRLTGLAYASKLYRELPELQNENLFSDKGNEVAFGTIGNASCAEGLFFETINACGVLQVPLVMSIWDDGYGISVPNEKQITKNSISEILAGFQIKDGDLNGYEIYVVKGWDYAELLATYKKAVKKTRETHIPALIHVIEVTQPQGHSTSGSHERYKSKERLSWEAERDCILQLRNWMISEGVFTADEADKIEKDAKSFVRDQQKEAWADYRNFLDSQKNTVIHMLEAIAKESSATNDIQSLISKLKSKKEAMLKDIISTAKAVLRKSYKESLPSHADLKKWLETSKQENYDRYNSALYSESAENALTIKEVKAEYSESSKLVDGREVLQACFDHLLKTDPRVVAFGEDVGHIGDVNQAFAGLQEKHGELRVSDTGIREATIMGQAIGLAMRGLRPIAEIQYLDYILYATQILSDDLACLQYRTKGGQKAPMIVRTRGHRLEGIWHAGSPIAHVLNATHGIRLLVPRNMTQAAGFYNTMMKSDEPAIIIECLNGYRLKEKLPDNIGEFTVPLGVPEVLEQGSDITIVSYGSTLRIAQEAMEQLNEVGISVELIDVQTLLPFDINHKIKESIKKTNRVLFLDEDMPGGGTAYMMQHVLDVQGAWEYLDSKPVCLAAQPNRPAYASDGDYFSKPNAEDIFEAVYEMMSEFNPEKFPKFL